MAAIAQLTDVVRDGVADARAIEPHRPMQAVIADGVRVLGDEDRLRQVVGNLFANIRVHTPRDTPAARRAGRRPRLRARRASWPS